MASRELPLSRVVVEASPALAEVLVWVTVSLKVATPVLGLVTQPPVWAVVITPLSRVITVLMLWAFSLLSTYWISVMLITPATPLPVSRAESTRSRLLGLVMLIWP